MFKHYAALLVIIASAVTAFAGAYPIPERWNWVPTAAVSLLYALAGVRQNTTTGGTNGGKP